MNGSWKSFESGCMVSVDVHALESKNTPSGQCPLGKGCSPCRGEVWHPPVASSEARETPAANGPQRRFGQPANPPIPGRASTSLPPSPDIALQRLCPRPHWPRLSTNLQPATRTCLHLDAAPVAGPSPRSPHDDAQRQRRLTSRLRPRTRPAAVVPSPSSRPSRHEERTTPNQPRPGRQVERDPSAKSGM